MRNLNLFTKKTGFQLVAILILLSSCKKLQEEPKSVITPNNFYTTTTQIQSAYTASMSLLWSRNQGYSAYMDDFNQDDQIVRGDLNISENYGAELWAAHYSALLNINTAIKALKKGLVGVDQGQIDDLMGQGKFLRAFNYFMLVRIFGGVPLITEDTPDPVNVKMARSTVQQVYDQIISDFTDAIAKLPVTRSADMRGLPTRDAAKGLLAKAYLTMATFPLNKPENYAKAAEMAGEVIDSANYSLVPDISTLFSVANQYGPEMMWSFNSNAQNQGPDPRIWSDMRGFGDICAEPTWEQAYPKQPRKDAFIETTLNGVLYYDLGDYWPGVKKFQYDAPADFAAGRSVVSMPIIRFADVLLIFAEADNMAKGAPSQKAVDAINRVIDRANGHVINSEDPLATTSMTMAEFDNKVIMERDYELCFEIDRWFDLIRKHILKQESLPDYQINFSDNDYLWPIPTNDIQVDPLLTQNPGY
ncbi:RagB/SusD family nutrient uptake outer membrane protein [Mucilaginibacter sp. BT774]|uniref:RagB/SusD family nutrient uptake outer membrane protein n=1 Tax=Mucilaginibacter sp. BT774 TaxID=3062276 RepID=UPI0026756EDD|nr:RagB/SusD family nutrient uptake outer membrane protein [Mucilaginibacter sp. BT774]MDO3628363.1 RagB/SusD family nutrient uptake outer membrane protein [Mucilaginibacter sp. BT774]